MTVEVWVGTDQASLDQAIREAWVVRQIKRRRRAGESVCFRVRLMAEAVAFTLGSPECGSRSGGRDLSPAEEQILVLWQQHGLNTEGFAPGRALVFLKELQRLL